MPLSITKSYSKKSGKTEDEIEKMWKDTEHIVRKSYPDIDDTSDSFYAIVNKVVQKRLKINTEDASTTTTTANVGSGQSGQYQKRIGCVDKKFKKGLRSAIDYIDNY